MGASLLRRVGLSALPRKALHSYAQSPCLFASERASRGVPIPSPLKHRRRAEKSGQKYTVASL